MIVVGVGKSKQKDMCCLKSTNVRWRGVIIRKDDMHEYDVIKGYKLENVEIEKETMRFLKVIRINSKGMNG